MPVPETIQSVFGHFQNLNLLALLRDLSSGHTAHTAWVAGTRLCPIAHGLPTGDQVSALKILGQDADLKQGCFYAARHLGARPADVLRFVRSWDDGNLEPGWLYRSLLELWHERLADAEAMQDLLEDWEEIPEETDSEPARSDVTVFDGLD